MNTVTAVLVGGPTVVLRYAGLTIVTDPTFDPPGTQESLTKTEGPAIDADALPPIDLALVSHDHHPDNLDVIGLEVARGATLDLTTLAGAARKEGFRGMEPGDVATIDGPTAVTVTAVEALHGPAKIAAEVGPVIGFVLRADGWPTLYFSGDNALVSVVRGIARAHPDVSIALLCMGAASVPNRGPVLLTLNADRAARVAALWPDAAIVPVHVDGWKHFSQQRVAALAGLNANGVGDRVVALERGVETPLNSTARYLEARSSSIGSSSTNSMSISSTSTRSSAGDPAARGSSIMISTAVPSSATVSTEGRRPRTP